MNSLPNWMRLFLLSLAAFGLSGCSRPTSPVPTALSGAKIRIALLPKQKGIPYFSSCNLGAQAAAKELGDVEVIYDGPTDGSPEKAAAMIDQWVLKGIDVIAVSPNNPDVVAPAMKKARAKGVKVITWDADGSADAREWFVNQATAQSIGFALVDTMAKDLGGDSAQGELAIVTATLTAANQNEWIKHIKLRLNNYPGLKLVDIKPCDEDQKKAFQVTQDFMKAYPDVKGIFAITSAGFPGAAEAIRQSGNAGKVLVTGLATPNDMKSYVLDGTVKSVILWNTVDLGYLTVHTAKAMLDGKLKPGDKTFIAGRLGARAIDGDNILLGDYLVFTKENIAQFDF